MRAVTSGALGLLLVALVGGCGGSPADSGASFASAAQLSPGEGSSASPSVAATSPGPDASPSVAAISPSPDASLTPTASATPSGTPRTEWQLDLYKTAGMRYQYPDYYACTATAVQITLNFIALDGGYVSWSPSTHYATQESILKYERAHMTLPLWRYGSDAHGTRNALNYFGWGSMQATIYKDTSFATFDAAAKAIVSSIARMRMPAIVFTWYGAHSQVVTGYKAHGENPATSDNFTVEGVYLTDPLLGHSYVYHGRVGHRVAAIKPDKYVSLAQWKYGPDEIRFTDYEQTDSTLRDPIDGAIGRLEWRRKWVAVLAA